MRRSWGFAAALLGLFFLLSRFLGFARDSLLAYLFGQGHLMNDFSVAYLVPDALYSALVAGGVTSAFIPVLTRYASSDREEESWSLVSSTLTLTLLVMGGLFVLLFLLAPVWLRWLAPGFGPADLSRSILLARLMLGSMLLNSLAAVLVGAQNSRHHFTATGLGPVAYNLTIIGLGLLLNRFWGIQGFALAVTAGAGANLLMQIFGTRRLHLGLRLQADLAHPGLKQVGRLLLPVLAINGAWQANLVINQSLLGSLEAPGVVNALVLANRLTLLPVLLGTTAGISLLPAMTEALVRGSREDLAAVFGKAIRVISFLAIPAGAGLYLLSDPLVRILFQHGRFGTHAALVTSSALGILALGVLPLSLTEVVNRAFYAMEDTLTPLKAAALYLALAVGLDVLLLHLAGYRGLALAYALGSYLNLGLLLGFLRRRMGRVGGRRLLRTILQSGLASLGMVLAVRLYQRFLPEPAGLIARILLDLVVPATGGGLIFLLLSGLLKSEEATEARRLLRRSGV